MNTHEILGQLPYRVALLLAHETAYADKQVDLDPPEHLEDADLQAIASLITSVPVGKISELLVVLKLLGVNTQVWEDPGKKLKFPG